MGRPRQTVVLLSTLGFLTVSLGCGVLGIGGNDDTDDDTELEDFDPGDDDTDPVVRTPLDPDFAIVSGAFAYDETDNLVYPYTVPQSGGGSFEQPITLEVRLIDSSTYDPEDDFTYCSVVFRSTSSIGAPDWLPTANAQAGRNVTMGVEVSSAADMTSTCGEFELPAEWGGGDDPGADAITSWDWGFAVGSETGSTQQGGLLANIEGAVVDALGQSAWDNDWEPYIVDGMVYWSALEGQPTPNEGGLINLDYVTAYEVDDSFTVEVDSQGEPYPIPAAQLRSGIAPTGAYVVQSWFVLNAGCMRSLDEC